MIQNKLNNQSRLFNITTLIFLFCALITPPAFSAAESNNSLKTFLNSAKDSREVFNKIKTQGNFEEIKTLIMKNSNNSSFMENIMNHNNPYYGVLTGYMYLSIENFKNSQYKKNISNIIGDNYTSLDMDVFFRDEMEKISSDNNKKNKNKTNNKNKSASNVFNKLKNNLGIISFNSLDKLQKSE